MTKVPLTLACTLTDRSSAILNNEVAADGVDFIITTGARPGEIMWRMQAYNEFDCCEVGLSVAFTSRKPWVAIPAFTARHFFNVDIIVNADSGIKEPADMEGKRVGLPTYGQTAAVWGRGILHDEYGVRPEKIHWYAGRSRERSTTSTSDLGVELTFLENLSLGEAILRGDLDAIIVNPSVPSLVDKKSPDLSSSPKVRTLFEEPEKEAVRYFKKTGIFPINHTLVLRKSVHETYPWIATNIFKAFEDSKRRAYAKWEDLGIWERFPSAIFLPTIIKDQERIFGKDPFSFGLSKNRNVIGTFARYLYEQKLVAKPIEVDSFFADTTLTY